MTSNKRFVSMNVELHDDWLSIVKSIGNSFSSVSILLEARAISTETIQQDKETKLLFTIPKEIESLEYVNYYFANEKIDTVIRKAELVARLFPEELIIVFFTNKTQLPSENFVTNLNSIDYPEEDICCTLNVLFDENVMLISVDRNHVDRVRNLLEEY